MLFDLELAPGPERSELQAGLPDRRPARVPCRPARTDWRYPEPVRRATRRRGRLSALWMRALYPLSDALWPPVRLRIRTLKPACGGREASGLPRVPVDPAIRRLPDNPDSGMSKIPVPCTDRVYSAPFLALARVDGNRMLPCRSIKNGHKRWFMRKLVQSSMSKRRTSNQ